jgi:hypothetical protein
MDGKVDSGREGMYRLLLAPSFLLLNWGAVLGQTRPVPQGGVPGGVPGGSPAPFLPLAPAPISAITGAPFSGEMISETVHALRDGTEMVQKGTSSRLHRDSQGRIRFERLGLQTHESLGIVYIYDPVAKVSYTLDTQKKIAYLSTIMPTSARLSPSVLYLPPLPPPGILTVPGVILSGIGNMSFGPQHGTVSLGTKQMEGLAVDGTRLTVALPVGWEGYDRSFEITVENWLSKDLDVIVLWTTDDPRVGRSTWKLTHMSRDEPDGSLFHVPAEYTLYDPQRKHSTP